jgi:hypothetical protein
MSRAKRADDAYAGKKGATACVHGGYVYEFQGRGSRNWKKSPDEKWDTIMLGKKHCGRIVGTRKIDGSFVNVITVRGQYIAALPHAFSSRRKQDGWRGAGPTTKPKRQTDDRGRVKWVVADRNGFARKFDTEQQALAFQTLEADRGGWRGLGRVGGAGPTKFEMMRLSRFYRSSQQVDDQKLVPHKQNVARHMRFNDYHSALQKKYGAHIILDWFPKPGVASMDQVREFYTDLLTRARPKR